MPAIERRFIDEAAAGTLRGAHEAARYAWVKLLRAWEGNVVPGVLQTAGYARAVLEGWAALLWREDLREMMVRQLLEDRDERVKAFAGGGAEAHFIVGEEALLSARAPADVMDEQLDSLLQDIAGKRRIGILPLQARRGIIVPPSGFWIFDRSLVAVEVPSQSLGITGSDDVRLYERIFDSLQPRAVYGRGAAAIVRDARTSSRS